MVLNLVYNVISSQYSQDTLRLWMTGSQSCEQLFQILRSMTLTFSTMVNFMMKGILDKVHKLQFLAMSEPDETIVFPRVQQCFLQLKEESEATFAVPTIDNITAEILKANQDVTKICNLCRIQLQSYTDLDLAQHVQDIIGDAVTNDRESEGNSNACSDDERINTIDENNVSPDDVVTIQETCLNL